jgi:hypothetical protein
MGQADVIMAVAQKRELSAGDSYEARAVPSVTPYRTRKIILDHSSLQQTSSVGQNLAGVAAGVVTLLVILFAVSLMVPLVFMAGIIKAGLRR